MLAGTLGSSGAFSNGGRAEQRTGWWLQPRQPNCPRCLRCLGSRRPPGRTWRPISLDSCNVTASLCQLHGQAGRSSCSNPQPTESRPSAASAVVQRERAPLRSVRRGRMHTFAGRVCLPQHHAPRCPPPPCAAHPKRDLSSSCCAHRDTDSSCAHHPQPDSMTRACPGIGLTGDWHDQGFNQMLQHPQHLQLDYA